jgi:hypothetical protein
MMFSFIHLHILDCAQEKVIDGLCIEVSTFVAGRAVIPSKTSILVTYYYFSELFYGKFSYLRGLGLYEFLIHTLSVPVI